MPKAVSLFLIRYGTQFAARNVRYWHIADIASCTAHVGFRGQKRTLPPGGMKKGLQASGRERRTRFSP
jgi:hypothetical protein